MYSSKALFVSADGSNEAFARDLILKAKSKVNAEAAQGDDGSG